jgi:FtsP/CotA-like multicopper oxidase with cupredoxin domain
VAVAAVAFLLARPSDDDGDDREPAETPAAETSTERTPTATTEAPPPPPAPERVTIRGGEVVGGARKITVEKGATVRIVVTSAAPDEIHLHGYDITRNVAPGKPARFRLKADAEGEFELEAHDLGHKKVASLVVEPL